uniref:Uncharacterized protein n=1 Tax=Panagrolaimus davidi TaxID=227884 RepID=A0A914PDX3_9BILA
MGIKQLFVKNGLNKIISNEKSSHSLDLFVHSARIKVDQFGADGRDDTEDHLKYEDIRNQPGDTCPPPNCREIDFIADQPFLFFVALWNFSGDKNRIQSIQFAGIFS